MSIDQLTQEALSLPNDLRLQLMEALLESFEPPLDEAIQSEWLAEAKSGEIVFAMDWFSLLLEKRF